MRGVRSALPGAVVLVAALAAGADPEPAERPAAAAEAVAELRKELGQALKGALAQGPVHAVGFCQGEAPGITAGQQRPGLAVGRTSHRLRNPANAPEPWMLPFLEEFRAGPARPGAWRSVDLGPRGTGYVEPIYLKPLCATCHGTEVDPALLEAIRERYPEDRATGFEAGELRGLFWAVVARPPAEPE